MVVNHDVPVGSDSSESSEPTVLVPALSTVVSTLRWRFSAPGPVSIAFQPPTVVSVGGGEPQGVGWAGGDRPAVGGFVVRVNGSSFGVLPPRCVLWATGHHATKTVCWELGTKLGDLLYSNFFYNFTKINLYF